MAAVVGVEKITDVVGPELERAIAESTDYDYELAQGLTPTAQAALLMQRYLHEYQAPARGFRRVSHSWPMKMPPATPTPCSASHQPQGL